MSAVAAIVVTAGVVVAVTSSEAAAGPAIGGGYTDAIAIPVNAGAAFCYIVGPSTKENF